MRIHFGATRKGNFAEWTLRVLGIDYFEVRLHKVYSNEIFKIEFFYIDYLPPRNNALSSGPLDEWIRAQTIGTPNIPSR